MPTSSKIVHISRFHMVPRRDAIGRVIPGKFRLFWGGRKPSRYLPHVGKKQLRRAEAKAA